MFNGFYLIQWMAWIDWATHGEPWSVWHYTFQVHWHLFYKICLLLHFSLEVSAVVAVFFFRFFHFFLVLHFFQSTFKHSVYVISCWYVLCLVESFAKHFLPCSMYANTQIRTHTNDSICKCIWINTCKKNSQIVTNLSFAFWWEDQQTSS